MNHAIHDPVYRRIELSGLEHAIINTSEMQRLRGIQQLGLADVAYPGANHTRFEHSIGTMHMAGRIAGVLGLDEYEIGKVRLAGLLHDIGHCAFSHVVESYLARNPGYQPVIDGRKFVSHEMFTQHIIRSLAPKPEISSLTGLENASVDAPGYFSEIAQIATGTVGEMQKHYLGQIVSGDIDADRIDFLLRDSYHTGVSLGLIDVDQIVQSLSLHRNRIVLGGGESYDEDMALTAAESMLIARAHHYSAIIHNPRTQSARAMLMYALEDALSSFESGGGSVPGKIVEFFTAYDDADLLNFISRHGGAGAQSLLSRLRRGNLCSAVIRFNHKTLNPKTRMALSTIARHGRAKKMFESELAKRLAQKYGMPVLIDLDVASGIPKSARVLLGGAESFLYDESPLANGLVRAISRQLSLCVFCMESACKLTPKETLGYIDELSPMLLRFIRGEMNIPIEGLLLIFYRLHAMFSKIEGDRVVIPRVHNITWLYRTVRDLRENETLRNLLDYNFHELYGFHYSDRLFEDIQILVAMGMVDEDLRYYEKDSRRRQRYEYVLTHEGEGYASMIAKAYAREIKVIDDYLTMNRHMIPRDMLSTPKVRYEQ